MCAVGRGQATGSLERRRIDLLGQIETTECRLLPSAVPTHLHQALPQPDVLSQTPALQNLDDTSRKRWRLGVNDSVQDAALTQRISAERASCNASARQ